MAGDGTAFFRPQTAGKVRQRVYGDHRKVTPANDGFHRCTIGAEYQNRFVSIVDQAVSLGRFLLSRFFRPKNRMCRSSVVSIQRRGTRFYGQTNFLSTDTPPKRTKGPLSNVRRDDNASQFRCRPSDHVFCIQVKPSWLSHKRVSSVCAWVGN